MIAFYNAQFEERSTCFRYKGISKGMVGDTQNDSAFMCNVSFSQFKQQAKKIYSWHSLQILLSYSQPDFMYQRYTSPSSNVLIKVLDKRMFSLQNNLMQFNCELELKHNSLFQKCSSLFNCILLHIALLRQHCPPQRLQKEEGQFKCKMSFFFFQRRCKPMNASLHMWMSLS